MALVKNGNRPTTLQERLEIMVRAECKENDTEIANAMHLSLAVVRKWRRRARDQGREGLASCMGRPSTGPLGHFGQEMRATLKTWRKEHPGWGPGTLQVELKQDKRFADLPIPSCPRIAAYLKSENLIRPYERHTKLSSPVATIVSECHEEWELDAQGACLVPGVGLVSLLNFGDLFSHLRISWACLKRRKAGGADYQLALRRGFLCFGLPRRISLDHDSAFFDNTTPSPFPSEFHLWLIALGIEVRFLVHRPPREHAFIERSHQVIYRQAVQGQSFTPESLQPYLDQRLNVLNQLYPSRSLHGQPPLTAFPQAIHSGREYRPEWEENLLDLSRVFDYLAKQTWFRQTSSKGQLLLGSHRYGLGKAWIKQTVRVNFDPDTQKFVCWSLDEKQSQCLKACNLTKEDLMGELDMNAFAHYQYAFPWSVFAVRENHTADLLGTTL